MASLRSNLFGAAASGLLLITPVAASSPALADSNIPPQCQAAKSPVQCAKSYWKDVIRKSDESARAAEAAIRAAKARGDAADARKAAADERGAAADIRAAKEDALSVCISKLTAYKAKDPEGFKSLGLITRENACPLSEQVGKRAALAPSAG